MKINIKSIKTLIDGPIPLILKYCRKLKIAECINSKVQYDENKRIVSPGTGIEALIANILTDKKALSKTDEFYDEKDIEKYFGSGITAENLNDDALGRSLDDLYSIDAKETFSSIAIESLKTFDIKLDSVHADTTSVNLYGNYEKPSGKNGCIKLERGHSKDHRPDLKQFMFGLACTQDNLDAIADCKIDFISLLPSTYNIEKKLKETACEKDNGWNVLGKISGAKDAGSYKIQSFIDKIDGRDYRFLVCHSDYLNNRKLRSLNSNINKENSQLKKLIKKVEKNGYYCENDALGKLIDL
jgi:transposase